MNTRSKMLKATIAFLTPLLLASLACSGFIPRSQRVETAERTEPVGFDFTIAHLKALMEMMVLQTTSLFTNIRCLKMV